MTSELIGKKLRFVLSNNFHYNGLVLEEDARTVTIRDQKGARVTISKHSILIQEEVVNGN